MQKINTVICPIIRSDFIGGMLDSLKANTEPNYNTIVIDQTVDDKAYLENHHKASLWIRSYRNLGFSKAHNLGIRLAQTPYITLANDDISFINKGWWGGIVDTFAMDQSIIAVNPMSPKEGSWGYGLRTDNHDEWTPPAGFATDPEKLGVYPIMKDGMVIDSSEKAGLYYDKLLNEHPTWNKNSLCDAIAMWCTVFTKKGLEEVGLLEERFYPGGGEDYDMCCRAYSCGYPTARDICNPTYHRRMVGTTKSWVWHHWGSSKDQISGKDPKNVLFASRERWNSNEELWGTNFDVWGHRINDKGEKVPLKRKASPTIDSL
jgi:GT2 family glycosyltransferase